MIIHIALARHYQYIKCRLMLSRQRFPQFTDGFTTGCHVNDTYLKFIMQQVFQRKRLFDFLTFESKRIVIHD